MLVFRISKSLHAEDLSGEGSRLIGGRWNSKGIPVVYTSTNISLAVLENLVHFSTRTPPADMKCVTFEIPDSLISDIYDNFDAVSNNQAYIIGDKWLKSLTSLGLEVPSAVIPQEHNILINPLHSDISKVKIVDNVPFPFDERLFLVKK